MDEQLAAALAEVEAEQTARRERLEELRKRRRASATAAAALEALPPKERLRFARVLAKDAGVLAAAPKRPAKPSDVFTHGPSAKDQPAVALAKLLMDAAKAADVVLPPKALADLPTSPLPEAYHDVMLAGPGRA